MSKIYVVVRQRSNEPRRTTYVEPDPENGPFAAFDNERAAEIEVDREDLLWLGDYVHKYYELELKNGNEYE